jgi:hypothetical protein
VADVLESEKTVAFDRARPPGRKARDDAADAGVYVRTLAAARSVIYQRVMGEGPSAGTVKAAPVLDLGVAPAPQLGQLRYLPFRNRAFEANALSLVLREDGSVEKFEYKKTRAAGAAAASAASDAIGQVEARLAQREKEAAANRKAAREEAIADLQFRIDGLTKQAALLKLQTPDAQLTVKDETARIQTETALLEAQLAYRKAEAAVAQGTAP